MHVVSDFLAPRSLCQTHTKSLLHMSNIKRRQLNKCHLYVPVFHCCFQTTTPPLTRFKTVKREIEARSRRIC